MKKNNSSALIALTTAAMFLPGMSKKAEANSLDQATTVDYKYSHYQEGDIPADKLSSGSAARYIIDVNQLKFKTTLSSSAAMTVSGVQESMSGASPWFIQPGANGKLLQVMSGATIEEKRNEFGLDFSLVGSSFDNALSFSYSQENDYISYGLGYSASFRLNQNLTTLDFGVNGSKDYIDATDAKIYLTRPTEETKNRLGLVAGMSHVATKTTLFGVSVSYAALSGFLSDPYKLAVVESIPVQDSRPDSNGQLSGTFMLREFFPKANAALHADYRYYTNDWGMTSTTVELAWYQNLGKSWQLIPSIRSYEQSAVVFYQPYYTGVRLDGFYSSDYRLSEFSATSGQLKLVKKFDSFSIDIAYENYEATGDNPGLISYEFYSLGMGIKF